MGVWRNAQLDDVVRSLVAFSLLFFSLFSTHFRVRLVVVRPGVGERSRAGATQRRRGEQRAADEGGEDHREGERFFLLSSLSKAREEK